MAVPFRFGLGFHGAGAIASGDGGLCTAGPLAMAGGVRRVYTSIARDGSHDDSVSFGLHVQATDRCERCSAAAVHGPDVDEEDLVFVVIDDLREA